MNFIHRKSFKNLSHLRPVTCMHGDPHSSNTVVWYHSSHVSVPSIFTRSKSKATPPPLILYHANPVFSWNKNQQRAMETMGKTIAGGALEGEKHFKPKSMSAPTIGSGMPAGSTTAKTVPTPSSEHAKLPTSSATSTGGGAGGGLRGNGTEEGEMDHSDRANFDAALVGRASATSSSSATAAALAAGTAAMAAAAAEASDEKGTASGAAVAAFANAKPLPVSVPLASAAAVGSGVAGGMDEGNGAAAASPEVRYCHAPLCRCRASGCVSYRSVCGIHQCRIPVNNTKRTREEFGL